MRTHEYLRLWTFWWRRKVFRTTPVHLSKRWLVFPTESHRPCKLPEQVWQRMKVSDFVTFVCRTTSTVRLFTITAAIMSLFTMCTLVLVDYFLPLLGESPPSFIRGSSFFHTSKWHPTESPRVYTLNYPQYSKSFKDIYESKPGKSLSTAHT